VLQGREGKVRLWYCAGGETTEHLNMEQIRLLDTATVWDIKGEHNTKCKDLMTI
jgi:hypothetical protein